ncbi:hypothetical protein MMC25_006070 [Agyrium rufum]|nr:hypothetical protein [Agyrium rufum]
MTTSNPMESVDELHQSASIDEEISRLERAGTDPIVSSRLRLLKSGAIRNYQQFNRGDFDAGGNVTAHTDHIYLRQILHDYASFIYAYLTNYLTHTESDISLEILCKIENEVMRLESHHDLFPYEDMPTAFFEHFNALCRVMCKVEEIVREHEETVQDFEEALQGLTDSFAQFASVNPRTRWQQFLHNKAPGVGLDPSVIPTQGSMQILPYCGMEILYGWTSENSNIRQSLGTDILDEEEMEPDRKIDYTEITRAGNVRRCWPRRQLPPHHTAHGPSRPRVFVGKTSLESLSLDFNQLERGQPEFPGLNPIPAFFVEEVATISD